MRVCIYIYIDASVIYYKIDIYECIIYIYTTTLPTWYFKRKKRTTKNNM